MSKPTLLQSVLRPIVVPLMVLLYVSLCCLLIVLMLPVRLIHFTIWVGDAMFASLAWGCGWDVNDWTLPQCSNIAENLLNDEFAHETCADDMSV